MDDWGWAKLNSYKTNYMKVLFTIAYYVARCEGDAYIVTCGDNNMGKSHFSIRSARRIAKILRDEFKIPAHFNIAKNVFFTPTKSNMTDLQGDNEYQILVFDEGYFMGLNLDFNVELAKETTRVAMATRAKHNVIFFNFQRPTRATKTLLERFKIMFIKPTKKDSLLMCRSSLSVMSKDAWGMEAILKEDNDKKKVWAIKHNQNYIRGVTTNKLPAKIEAKFQRLQKKALQNRMDAGKSRDEIKSEYERLGDNIFKKEEKGHLAYSSIKEYLAKPINEGGPGLKENEIKSFMTFYTKFSVKKKSKKFNDENDEDEENDSTPEDESL